MNAFVAVMVAIALVAVFMLGFEITVRLARRRQRHHDRAVVRNWADAIGVEHRDGESESALRSRILRRIHSGQWS